MSIKPRNNRFAVAVVVPDKAGILHELTAAITDLGGNIDGISETVVEGYFTALLTAGFSLETSAEQLRSSIRERLSEANVELIVTPHNPTSKRDVIQGDRYIVTLSGKDKKGLLKRITGFLSERGINIEDWQVTFSGEQVTQIGELRVPNRLDIGQLQVDLRDAMKEFGAGSCLYHENIFRAISEIAPVKPILRGER